jgi:hypothetical protein
MSTTLDIADDVLAAAKECARRENKTAGEVISELARTALTARQTSGLRRREPRAHYGLRQLPKRGNLVINEQVDKLRNGDAY